jgi:hypothetical protein
LVNQVESPELDLGWEKRSQSAVSGIKFVGHNIDPDIGDGVAVAHCNFFESLDSSVEGGCIITVGCVGIICTEQGGEELKFTVVGKSGNGSGDGYSIDGRVARMREGDEQRDRVGENRVKTGPGIQRPSDP